MIIAETERTILREITDTDAEFMLDLLNQPSFIKYIGDRGVRTLDDAREFIEKRYRASYREHGYGLYTVERKDERENGASSSEDRRPKTGNRKPNLAIGICGFVKRDYLPDADIGFAFLPQFEGKGYAFESASAALEYGRKILGLRRVLAITTIDNDNSARLLFKLGFKFDRLIEHGDEELKLFSADL